MLLKTIFRQKTTSNTKKIVFSWKKHSHNAFCRNERWVDIAFIVYFRNAKTSCKISSSHIRILTKKVSALMDNG